MAKDRARRASGGVGSAKPPSRPTRVSRRASSLLAAEAPAFKDEEALRQEMYLTRGELAALNKIASGKPVPNANAVLTAIRMKLDYTLTKPVQRIEADNKIQIEVVTLGRQTTVEVLPPKEPTPCSEPPLLS